MSESRGWLVLAAIAVSGLLLYLLAPILIPFAGAMILAYMGDPLVDRLETRGLSRTLSVVVVYLLLTLGALLLLVVLLPMLHRQATILLHNLPGYLDWLQSIALPAVSGYLGIEPPQLNLVALKQLIAREWQGAGSTLGLLVAAVSRSGMTLLGWVVNLALVLVVTFYMLRDWDHFVTHIHRLLPRRIEPLLVRLATASDEVLGAFFRGQLLVMASLGGIYAVGLWMVGLELALLLGMVAGLVSFVPYLGFIVGILSAGVVAVMQFHELLPLLYVVAVFMVGQAAEGIVLTPLFVGERIGLHPVAVIFAVLAGGQLFGFLGILLALPVAAVCMVLLRHLHGRYLDSTLYRGGLGGDGSDGVA